MEYNLNLLFAEGPVAATEFEGATSSQLCYLPTISAVDTSLEDDEFCGIRLANEDVVGSSVTDGGLPFGIRTDTYTEAFLQERNQSQEKAIKHKKAYEDLERRVYKQAIVGVDLPKEMLRRLNRLRSEAERYRSENKQLRGNLKAAKSGIATLRDEIACQENKLKGAGKKVRKAKDVAGKQEEKMKSAVHNKQLHAASERKMKLERNKAIAEVASFTKLCDDLQADLEVERSGQPHLRKGDVSSNEVFTVIPIELTVERAHFLKLATVFGSYQINLTEENQQWYDDWKKTRSPVQQCLVELA